MPVSQLRTHRHDRMHEDSIMLYTAVWPAGSCILNLDVLCPRPAGAELYLRICCRLDDNHEGKCTSHLLVISVFGKNWNPSVNANMLHHYLQVQCRGVDLTTTDEKKACIKLQLMCPCCLAHNLQYERPFMSFKTGLTTQR